uniref:Ig-like domain-containing protein n=1 Tax=Urocitellus parryii TaxID=9999 RepID=A0A8D2H925_UROPR
MTPILISMLVMILTFGGIRAQTVTQPEEHIAVFEGALVQVKCNYSYTGSPVLFWYVQYPGQGLQVLLKQISRDSAKGFTAALDRGEKSFHLQKPSAYLDDSATYYCALSAQQLRLQGKLSKNPSE